MNILRDFPFQLAQLHGLCLIQNTEISVSDENDYDNYMELLIQEGFSVVENVSEKIKGENYVSVGTLLSNGEKGLSISYIPDNLTIYVSFEIRLVQSK